MSRIRFDAALPINARRDDICAAVERHPVLIVCGETGSGKTTQLPKMLLEMGRSKDARIGHTQPRRIAARSVAARIAEELGTERGGVVGCKVRFHDEVWPRTALKLMTDGILLAETQGDRELSEYGSIILDEAHERSLNIDFLLGYMKRLVRLRPELRVVVTSATIDAERFSRHFDGAPVIEVSGRLYPVELRYRSVGGDAADTTRGEEEAALADAVDELCRGGRLHPPLLRGGLRQAPGIHRAGAAARLARLGDPAREEAGARRGRRFPVPRSAEPACHRGWLRPAGGARRRRRRQRIDERGKRARAPAARSAHRPHAG